MAWAMVLVVGCIFVACSIYISKNTLKELDQVENRILRARLFAEDNKLRKPDVAECYINDTASKNT